jgi:hypothetical protein
MKIAIAIVASFLVLGLIANEITDSWQPLYMGLAGLTGVALGTLISTR